MQNGYGDGKPQITIRTAIRRVTYAIGSSGTIHIIQNVVSEPDQGRVGWFSATYMSHCGINHTKNRDKLVYGPIPDSKQNRICPVCLMCEKLGSIIRL